MSCTITVILNHLITFLKYLLQATFLNINLAYNLPISVKRFIYCTCANQNNSFICNNVFQINMAYKNTIKPEVCFTILHIINSSQALNWFHYIRYCCLIALARCTFRVFYYYLVSSCYYFKPTTVCNDAVVPSIVTPVVIRVLCIYLSCHVTLSV